MVTLDTYNQLRSLDIPIHQEFNSNSDFRGEVAIQFKFDYRDNETSCKIIIGREDITYNKTSQMSVINQTQRDDLKLI